MSSFAELEDLVWLFESEPQLEFENERWPVSAATWTTDRGGARVMCTIAPFDGSVHVTCSTAGLVTEIHLRYVVDSVSIDRTHGSEALHVVCVPLVRIEPIRLQLKPAVRVSASTDLPWD